MNIINSIRFSGLAENSFLSNIFSSSITGKKIAIIAAAAFALYVCFSTCRYWYYNWKKIEDGPNKTVDIFGCIHEGEFKDGKLNGQGSREMYFAVAKGEFKNGKLNGQGTISEDLGVLTVESTGEFKNHHLNGQGKKVINSKKYVFFGPTMTSTLEGEFKNDELHGQGKRTWRDGSFKEGKFENGQFIG